MNIASRERKPGALVEVSSEISTLTATLGSASPRGGSSYGISATDIAGHMRKLEEIEGELIRMAIERYHGRMAEVARRLGIGRSTLYRKLKDLGLEQPADEEPESVRAAS